MNKASGPETGILPDKPRAARRDWRFERCARLLGAAAMDKLAGSHVAVFVTSVFGMAAASAAVRMLLSMDPFSSKME